MDNYEWAEACMRLVEHSLKEHYLVPPRVIVASLEQDLSEATDLLMIHAPPERIAARVRRPGFIKRHPAWGGQFTIRSRLANGAKTELAKVLEGWGDKLFYAHAADDIPTALERWYLLDLDLFRQRHNSIKPADADKPNVDAAGDCDGTYFNAYWIRDFGPDFIVCSYRKAMRPAFQLELMSL